MTPLSLAYSPDWTRSRSASAISLDNVMLSCRVVRAAGSPPCACSFHRRGGVALLLMPYGEPVAALKPTATRLLGTSALAVELKRRAAREVLAVDSAVPPQHSDVVAHTAFEKRDVVGTSALLWTKHVGCTRRAKEWTRNVSGLVDRLAGQRG
jgi:hypothetical protein